MNHFIHKKVVECVPRVRRQTLRPYWTAEPAGGFFTGSESDRCARGQSVGNDGWCIEMTTFP